MLLMEILIRERKKENINNFLFKINFYFKKKENLKIKKKN